MDDVVRKDDELTLVTVELLERLNIMKYNISNSMVYGEEYIIIGIDLFGSVLRDNNPDIIDDNKIKELYQLVDKIYINDVLLPYKRKRFVYLGIQRCFTMLEAYNMIYNNLPKKKVRDIKEY